MPKPIRLSLERLECRVTPAITGLPWINPSQLTLSLVPDGTAVGATSSSLFSLLNQQIPTGNWQLEVLRAFQTWAAQTNLNVGLVDDSGQALGAVGLIQGDSRFGDVRVSAAPLVNNSVAIGTPFMSNGSTWSGSVVLNSELSFGIQSGYDLYSIVLHEAGHVFGLGDNDDLASVMFHSYAGIRLGLSDRDVANLQQLYGVRQHDEFDARVSNDTMNRATSLGPFHAPIKADITTLDDVDFYQFRAPPNSQSGSTLYVNVRTSGISLLVPALTVYDHRGNVIGEAVATSPLGGDLSVPLRTVIPGANYYVRVSNATQSVFGIGSYELSLSEQAGKPGNGSPFMNVDNRNNDSLRTATKLTARNAGETGLHFGYTASISDPEDVDFYQVYSPKADSGLEMIALVTTEPGGLAPQIHVYGGKFNLVDARIVGNEPGIFSVQVLNATPDSVYYVRVSSPAGAGSPHSTGNYFLGVNFNHDQTVRLQSVATGTLSEKESRQARTLTVNRDGAMHFVLAAEAAGIAAQVQMIVYDQHGRLVFRMVALEGQPATSGVAYLKAGTYHVLFVAVSLADSPFKLNFGLNHALLSDPIGPTVVGSDGGSTSDTPPKEEYVWSTSSDLAIALWYSWITPYYYY